MEPVNILRDQPHAIGPSLFQLHERIVGGIRRFRGNQFTPPVVPFPDQPWVPLKGLRSCEILRAKVAPQAIYSAKGRHAAVGRNAGSREDSHVLSGGETGTSEENLIVGGHDRICELYCISTSRICVV